MRQPKCVKFITLIIFITVLLTAQACAQLDPPTSQNTPGPATTKAQSSPSPEPSASIEGIAVSAQDSGPNFPRLGMWWLDAYAEPASRIARYDLLLNEFEWNGLPEKLAEVRRLNPSIKVFRPLSPSERQLFFDDENGTPQPNAEIAELPSSFFLLEVGATLARDVSADSRYIYVDDMTYPDGQLKFHAGGDIAIGDHESAHVVAVDVKMKRLSVTRGYVRAATAHKRGEHVATHIRFWPGSWVMNVTDFCPRVQLPGFSEPVNWVEYVAALAVKRDWPTIYENEWDNYNYVDQQNLNYDGLIIDRFEDNESWLKWLADDGHVQVDLRHDNNAVPDVEFDAAWRRGTDIYYQCLRDAFPSLPIIRNNPLTVRFDQYNGQVFETGGWANPTREWWNALFMSSEWEDGY